MLVKALIFAGGFYAGMFIHALCAMNKDKTGGDGHE